MPMENIDGCLRNIMQEIFAFVSNADIPPYLVQDFLKTIFLSGTLIRGHSNRLHNSL